MYKEREMRSRISIIQFVFNTIEEFIILQFFAKKPMFRDYLTKVHVFNF